MSDAQAAYSGTLIAESLRVGAELEGIPLSVTKVCRVRVEDDPELSMLSYFDVAAARTADLAGVLSRVFEDDGGWYCDFRSDDEVFVVFCDRVCRYRRGDRTARSAVEDYALHGHDPKPSEAGPDRRPRHSRHLTGRRISPFRRAVTLTLIRPRSHVSIHP